MLKRIYIRLFSPVLLVACCIALLSSCNDSDKLVDDSLVTLKIVLPVDELQDVKSDETRAGTSTPGTEEESKINTLIFLIYNSGGTAIENYETVTIDNEWVGDHPMWDKNSKSLRIPVTQGIKRIYCIANWSLTGTTEMPVIDKTSASTETKLLNFVRDHTNVTPGNPPVMTADVGQVNITATMQEMPVKLRRQVARIELWPNINDVLSTLGAEVQITGIKFKSMPTKAYLFQKSPVASPSSIGQWNQSDFTAITSSNLTTTATEFATKYYIPEYVPGNNESLATEMVIRALYEGRTLYYRLKIDPSVNATPAHNKYTIERNHTYRYYLTIIGEGSTSETTRSFSGKADTGIAFKLEIR